MADFFAAILVDSGLETLNDRAGHGFEARPSGAPKRKLDPVKARVGAALCQQLIVGADLDDASGLDEEYLVGPPDRRKAVRDDQSRAPRQKPIESLLDHRLGMTVERARRLVENQNARISQDGRAIAMRWRSPPERRMPRSPT